MHQITDQAVARAEHNQLAAHLAAQDRISDADADSAREQAESELLLDPDGFANWLGGECMYLKVGALPLIETAEDCAGVATHTLFAVATSRDQDDRSRLVAWDAVMARRVASAQKWVQQRTSEILAEAL